MSASGGSVYTCQSSAVNMVSLAYSTLPWGCSVHPTVHMALCSTENRQGTFWWFRRRDSQKDWSFEVNLVRGSFATPRASNRLARDATYPMRWSGGIPCVLLLVPGADVVDRPCSCTDLTGDRR